MALMFYGCTNFNQPLNFNTSAVAAFNQMFHNCSNFNQSLSTFNVENGLALNSMLLNATAFNQDVSHFEFNKNAIMFGFLNGKASANYSATYYSALLNKMQARFVGTGRTQTNKTFDAGSIKRDASGTSARAALVADGWIITDGGL